MHQYDGVVLSPLAEGIVGVLEAAGRSWVGTAADLAASLRASRRGVQFALKALKRTRLVAVKAVRGHYTRITLVGTLQQPARTPKVREERLCKVPQRRAA